jgi:peptide/nickel transport system permease protein
LLLRTIALRLLLGIATVLAVTLVIFAATNVIPGDAARAILGRAATPEAVAQLQAEMGLDRPLAVQYLSWLGGLMHLDFGQSLVTRGPVSDLIEPRFRNSILLLCVTAAVAIPLSVVLGVAMALGKGRAFDNVLNTILIALAGIPEFIVGIVLIVLLSTQVFQILPPTSMVPSGDSVLGHPEIMVLPVMTLVIAILPYLARLVRSALIDALASEYVVTARLKGIPERQVIIRHALRNSLLPAIQGTALSLGYILGGAVVVEFIFQYPGMGTALRDAVGSRDLLVIQSIVLIFASGYVLFNLAADILSIVVTPRLRD